MNEGTHSAFAVLTPPGRGGIAVVRCIGPDAEAALAKCFRPAQAKKGAVPFSSLSEKGAVPFFEAAEKGTVPFSQQREKGTAPFSADLPCPGHLAYGHIVDAEGRPIDEVVLYHAETSGMGESPAAPAAGSKAAGSKAAGSVAIFEVNCHGGPAAVRAVCERLAAADLREVDGDRLMQLEGLPQIVRDARRALRRAFTPLAARILLDQLGGALAAAIAEILAPLGPGVSKPYLAPGEHTGGGVREGTSAADPPPVYSPGAKYGTAPAALAAIDVLLDRWRTCGRFLADPPRIVIAGRPNSGKSTLLNRLVGAERAITSAAPGTTRDYVEAEAALEGAPAVLVDTAGLREPGGEIERQGIARAREELARAAVVIYLIDAGEGPTPEDEAMLDSLGAKALAVLNKIDSRLAASQRRARSRLAISALTGEGVPALVAAVLEKLGWRAPAPGEPAPFTEDQASALASAREDLAAGRVTDAAARLKALLA